MINGISKMYRQIRVEPQFCDLQCILRCYHPSKEIGNYRLATVTYEVASSAFIVTRCLKYCSKISFSLVSKIIRTDFDVNGLVTGTNNLEKVIQLKQYVISMHSQDALSLHMWYSNNTTTFKISWQLKSLLKARKKFVN